MDDWKPSGLVTGGPVGETSFFATWMCGWI